MGIDEWATFTFTLFAVCLTGISTGSLLGSIFGMAYRFPSKNETQAAMMGSGIISVVICCVKVLTKLTFEQHSTFKEYRNSATAYFAISALGMMVCLILLFSLLLIPYSRKHIFKSKKQNGHSSPSSRRKKKTEVEKNDDKDDDEEEEREPLIDHSSIQQKSIEVGSVNEQQQQQPPKEEEEEEEEDVVDNIYEVVEEEKVLLQQEQQHQDEKNEKLENSIWKQALKKTWPNTLYIFLIFWVTQTVYPGLVVRIPTSFPATFLRDWFGVIITCIFSLFDFLGRSVPKFFQFSTFQGDRGVGGFGMLYICLIRMVFIPLFILELYPRWFYFNDVIPFTLTIFLALSNGYFGTVIMMKSASNISVDDDGRRKESEGEREEEEILMLYQVQQKSGTVMTFCMALGTAVGSWTGLLINYLVKVIYSYG